jgi:hypothetical protein
MIALMLTLLIAVGLGVFLILLSRRRNAAPVEGSGQAAVDARGALVRLQTGLLPPMFVSRLCDKADLEYIRQNAPASVQKRFLGERKRIAIAWVGRVSEEVKELRRFHTSQARFQPNLNLRSELGLAFDFASLLMACRILQLILKIRGPYAVPGIVRRTLRVTQRVCNVTEQSLESMTPGTGPTTEPGSAEAAG